MRLEFFFLLLIQSLKPLKLRKKYVLLGILFVSSFIARSQDVGREKIIKDLLFLTEQFSSPAAEGAAFQGSAGWFSSAAALDRWDFRVSFHGNALFVPDDKKRFDISNSQLDTLVIQGAERTTIPTAFGPSSEVRFEGTYMDIPFEFETFPGIDRDYVPHAFVQVAVGLPGNTEFTLRAMPEVTIDDVKASTFGAGLKHNFSQYFRGYTPEGFQLAGGVAYSYFDVDYRFTPVNIQIATLEDIDVKANVLMLEAIGSKAIGPLEIFGAVGFVSTAFDYEMGGTGEEGLKEINRELEKLGDVESLFKADLGLNVNLGRFRVSAMATAGKFLNGNLGLHVRI